MSEDKKIRESYFKRDKDFNEKMKEEMQEEENMLKSYFKEYKKPVAEDPSIVSTSASPRERRWAQSSKNGRRNIISLQSV